MSNYLKTDESPHNSPLQISLLAQDYLLCMKMIGNFIDCCLNFDDLYFDWIFFFENCHHLLYKAIIFSFPYKEGGDMWHAISMPFHTKVR